MAKKTVTIAGVDYTSRKALEEACRARTPKATSTTPTPMKLDDFWEAIIRGHPTIQEKVNRFDDEATAFGYRKNDIGEGTSMGLIGKNGKFMPFSYKTACLGHFPPKDPEAMQRTDVLDGMRRAIQYQIDDFRRKLPRLNGKIKCAATGAWTDPREIDIDHHPKTFKELADQYLVVIREDNGGALPEVEKHDAHHPDHNRLVNRTYEQAWIQWHEEEASFQALSRPAHQSKKNKGEK